ncbi:unnamed protein product [Protopolystoma xenopodis]|uniref:Uncharacterized protein n=1 Tax=Protopolystoma xenopodis TaxID=117903 RepID=A0A3S5C1D8_9PLAT|nr:unnamed protein product [Protopolystoma xenopodis]
MLERTAGRLVGWSAGRLVGWSAVRSVDRQVCLPVSLSLSGLVRRTVGHSVDRSVGSPPRLWNARADSRSAGRSVVH